MNSKKTFVSLLVLLAFSAGAMAQQSPIEVAGATTIDAAQAKVLYDRGAKFVDVRSSTLWDAGRVPGASYLDWSTGFNEPSLLRVATKSDEVVIYCSGPG